MLEHVDHRQLATELAIGRVDHLQRQQRAAAQGEEVVADADLLHLQQTLPQRHHPLLGGIARRFHRARRRLAARTAGVSGAQRIAVDLAVGAQRQRLQRHPLLWQHEPRQLTPQVLACLRLERRLRHALPWQVVH
ncbi:hypothetical protein, partial [Xanthomonas sp. 1678]|uniref:hypothetical protein n=1 Tax=Xanthomonas sp. 1678 TaxID=3158788 RepID=UPI00286BFEB9